MIQVSVLEPHDTIQPTDWCRPLRITSMSGGMSDGYSFKSMYSGTPENNVRWVQVQDCLGPIWNGKTVEEFLQPSRVRKGLILPMEFVRGEIPVAHRLDMKHFGSMRGLWEEEARTRARNNQAVRDLVEKLDGLNVHPEAAQRILDSIKEPS